jgi:hypothetical protein
MDIPQITFDPRRAIGIIHSSLLDDLARLQTRILHAERFGEDVVLYPGISTRLGTRVKPLADLIQKHGELVQQIRALERVLDAADEAACEAMVAAMLRDRKR